MTEKLTKSMTSNTLFGDSVDFIHLFLCLMQDNAQQVLSLISDKMPKPCFKHSIRFHTLCHKQNDEAALECIMQMNTIYQAQDVKIIFSESLTK